MSEGAPDLLAAALRAHAAGLCVVPPREDGSKRPDASEWKSRQHERPTEAELRALYANGRTGLGLVCGAVSGGLELLEFEDRETWNTYQARVEDAGLSHLLARLEEGYLEDAPRGGVHVLSYTAEPASTKLARRLKLPEEQRDPDDKIATLIETKGEGGFTIVAPSHGGVHPSGRPYVLVQGGFDTIASLTAEERESLHEVARSFDQLGPQKSTESIDRAATERGTRPGDDFNARTSWAELLEPAGWVRVCERAGLTYWRRPGKAVGISATTGLRGDADLLWVFTTSSVFESERGYGRFGAYALLHHGGDHAAAARTLAAQGFGQAAGTEGSSNPWPTPLSEAAYHGLVGEFVRLVEPHTEADPAALLIQFLVMFGNAAGRSGHFRAEADLHHTTLFATLVGVTSKARKGTSRGQARNPFRVAASFWSDHCQAGGLSSGEGLIWQIRDAIFKSEKVKGKGGGYQQVEVDPGVDDKRLMVFEGEFASVLRVLAREGNNLSAILRTAWDGGDVLQTLTKNSPAKATNAHVSVIGHITRDELRRYLDATECGNGFANRFLWICATRSKLLPEGGLLHTVDLGPLARKLTDVLAMARGCGELRRDDGARELWIKVYAELSEGLPGLLGAVTSRAEAQVMRLALIYALLDGADAIRREHLEAALEVWRYSLDSARHIFGSALGDPKADAALAAIRKTPGISRSDLGAYLFGKHPQAAALDRVLALLQERGLARAERAETGGRPTERWYPA